MLVLTGGGSHLVTKDEYEDFIVRFEWRAHKKGYNSSFFIRGFNRISMNQNDIGHLLAGPNKTKAVPKLHKEPGEWNEWEVTCIGTKVSLKVNGQLAWEHDGFKPKKGNIGFEAEGHAFDFRNLRSRSLNRSPDTLALA